jgi:hypothetical protein
VDFGGQGREADAAFLQRAPKRHAEQRFLPVGVDDGNGRPSVTLRAKGKKCQEIRAKFALAALTKQGAMNCWRVFMQNMVSSTRSAP